MLRMVCNLSIAVAFTALSLPGADSPLIGTWELNSAKSKFSPGPGPKSSTTTYSADGDWIVMKVAAVQADGQSVTRNARYRHDGKEYPYEGPLGKGTIATTKVDDHHMNATIKYSDGGEVKIVSAISKDGKTRTLTTIGKDGKGAPVNNKIVYDKK